MEKPFYYGLDTGYGSFDEMEELYNDLPAGTYLVSKDYSFYLNDFYANESAQVWTTWAKDYLVENGVIDQDLSEDEQWDEFETMNEMGDFNFEEITIPTTIIYINAPYGENTLELVISDSETWEYTAADVLDVWEDYQTYAEGKAFADKEAETFFVNGLDEYDVEPDDHDVVLMIYRDEAHGHNKTYRQEKVEVF